MIYNAYLMYVFKITTTLWTTYKKIVTEQKKNNRYFCARKTSAIMYVRARQASHEKINPQIASTRGVFRILHRGGGEI